MTSTKARESHRGAFPGDVMLPEGYGIEVVATDLNAPVHATFGPDGACYCGGGR